MKTSSLLWVIVTIAAIAAGAYMFSNQTTTIPDISPDTIEVYGSGDQALGQSDTNLGTKDALPLLGGEVVLNTTKDTKLGTFVTGFLGITVYTYAKDIDGISTCYESCAINWPPYTISTSDALTVDSSVTGEIGTTKRSDGTLQVTYNGKPLYFYPKDEKPGDTLGNGIGGMWSIVKP